MIRVIGLCGAARSGKNTFAKMLGETSGRPLYIQIAGPLKAYLRDLYDWTEEHTDGHLKDVPDKRYPIECKGCGGSNPKPGYVNVAIDIMGYSKPDWQECPVCKGEKVTYLTPRHAMQQLGGEFAESTYPAVYSRRAARVAAAHNGTALVTDCRYLRDIQAIAAIGGIIIEMGRGSDELSDEAKQHPSEVARATPEFQALVDVHITNEGTLDELRAQAYDVIVAHFHDQSAGVTRPKPGDWIISARFGRCVCIKDQGSHFDLRYKTHDQRSQRVIWVGTTDHDCTFDSVADKISNHVLTLEGYSPFEGSIG